MFTYFGMFRLLGTLLSSVSRTHLLVFWLRSIVVRFALTPTSCRLSWYAVRVTTPGLMSPSPNTYTMARYIAGGASASASAGAGHTSPDVGAGVFGFGTAWT
jgi:hypothetical protein